MKKVLMIFFLFTTVVGYSQLSVNSAGKLIGIANTVLITASDTNKNIGSFWVKYDRGENGKNALGGQEKDFYLRLKVRFSKSFYEKLEK